MDEGDREDVDLAGVLPQRREIVRRRIEAIEAYDRLPARGAQDVAKLCADLRIAPRTFYLLWRSWRLLRDPVALQGQAPRPRDDGTIGEDVAFVRGILSSHAPASSIEQETLRVERAAEDAGVAVRSRSALRRLVRAIREETSAPGPVTPPGTISLDFTVIELPISEGDRVVLPLATVVLHPNSGSVLGVRLSIGAPDARSAAQALSAFLDAVPEVGEETRIDTVEMPSDRDPRWTGIGSALARHRVARAGPLADRVPAGGAIARLVGRRLLDLPVRPRMVHRSSVERRPLVRSQRVNAALSLAEAQRLLDERIASLPAPTLALPEARAAAADLRAAAID